MLQDIVELKASIWPFLSLHLILHFLLSCGLSVCVSLCLVSVLSARLFAVPVCHLVRQPFVTSFVSSHCFTSLHLSTVFWCFLSYVNHIILFLVLRENIFVLKVCCFWRFDIFIHFMWAFAVVLSLSHSLSFILESIISHYRSSIQCRIPTVEEQVQEEDQEGAFPSQLFLTPLLFSSPPSLSAPFHSRLHPLGLQRPTTPSDARARPFSRHTPDTSNQPTLAMGAACTLFLGWRVLRPHLC